MQTAPATSSQTLDRIADIAQAALSTGAEDARLERILNAARTPEPSAPVTVLAPERMMSAHEVRVFLTQMFDS